MKCRLCGHSDTQQVISFGEMPLANAFLNTPHDTEEWFDLTVHFCPHCSLVQLTETVPPCKMFTEYAYLSSISNTMLEHAKDLAEKLIQERHLNGESQVIEIASNDAYLLQNFLPYGIQVLGIDPAVNVAKIAEAKGVHTLTEFFGDRLADTLPKADVILALNVLGHVPDLNGFVRGIKKVLKPDGVCVIEVPWVKDAIEKLEADTFYFEHCFYWSLTALVNLFKSNQLQIIKAERLPIHCGSLRIYVTHPNPFPPADRYGLEAILSIEKKLGVDRMEYYRLFSNNVEAMLKNARELLLSLKASGKTIVGYGAAAKGVQMLNMLGLNTQTISCVIDETPIKQEKFTPGSRIPIVPPGCLEEFDICVILAWNWKDEIIAKNPNYSGKWLTLLPEVKFL